MNAEIVAGIRANKMRRPVLLDAYCCAGGAGRGYHDAGFDVVGVDIAPQPNYPFTFIQHDALKVLENLARDGHALGRIFAGVHASPPCQMWNGYRRAMPDKGDDQYVNLIPQTRELLEATGLPYVIENVVGAPLRDPTLYCGSMFDPPLEVQRHRLFETNWPLTPPAWPCRHKLWGPDRFPGGRSKQRTGRSDGPVRSTVEIGSWDIPLDVQSRAMGIDWMTVAELSQAIPPTYTSHIGQQLYGWIIGQRLVAGEASANAA